MMDKSDQTDVVLRLLQALESKGSPRGETQVQKSAFFVDRGLEHKLDLDFILYRYGPYSFKLNKMLGRLRSSYHVYLSPNPSGSGSSIGITSSGLSLIKKSPAPPLLTDRAIEFTAERFGRLGVARLEQLATALYVTRHQPGDASVDLGPNPSVWSRASELCRLKPHIALNVATDAVKMIDLWLSQASAEGHR